MKLNADGTLSLPAATLTTQQVDQLIEQLAETRNRMSPPVPLDADMERAGLIQIDPSLLMGQVTDGTIRLGLRHGGLGWCVFDLSRANAATLRDFLAKRTGDAKHLTDDALPEGDAPKH